MTARRPVAALDLPDLTPGAPPTAKPEISWFDPTELVIDPHYQRDLSEAGKRLIRKIVEGWDWRKFKTPTAAWSDDGLEVIDGQHTAIAAATHPGVDSIPVMVVDAAGRMDRARAFIGVNKDRLSVTAPQMHRAAVAAGDPEAIAIDEVCAKAGVQLLAMSPSGGVYAPTQSISAAAIGALVRGRGKEKTTEILAALAKTDLAPVSAAAIKGADHLLHGKEFEGEVAPADLTRIIAALGADGDKEARAFSATHCVPLWRALAAVWFRGRRKRVSAMPTPSPAIEAPPPVSRTISKPAADPRPKPAERPALGGWAPGRFARICRTCDKSFTGGKLAITCEGCAYAGEKAA